MKDKIINNKCLCSICAIIIIVFLLYFINIFKSYPCGKDMISNMLSNFIHADFFHLISNLYGLYVLTRVEEKIGATKFFYVVCFILVMNSIFETILYKLTNLSCSVGFSGIIYGIFSWEMMSGLKNFDWYILSAIVFDIFSVLTLKRKIALLNHFIGIFSGIILGSFFKNIYI
jgi:membrane associated rhomboid family serine protease